MPATWEKISSIKNDLALQRGEWAGYPMPVDHARLVMEPRFPLKSMNGVKFSSSEDRDPGPKLDIINQWYCWRRGLMVHVARQDGKSVAYISGEGSGTRLKMWMDTLGVASAPVWSIDAENNALRKLASLVTPHAYRCYVLSGSFLETSKRSKVSYLFRKLRPTLAIRPGPSDCTLLAALCLHPLGYYEGTWAGVMTPTDDVIAHLLMMRADEANFWRKANHHHGWQASSGI